MSPHLPHRAVALFSGGLDSILAVKLVQEQGVQVECLHFVSPFFGKPKAIGHWRKTYGLAVTAVDISEDFAALLVRRPKYGFGSVLNPCVDCKILMMRHARSLMEQSGSCCIISGEVLGQRPMSQRRDSLHIIQRDAEVKGALLRPLCALRLDPTQAELDGRIDRSRLGNIAGRGRKEQLLLAERFGLKEIPTPAGGCRLTEPENARSYWPVLRHVPLPVAADFALANTGRQYWHGLEDAAGTSACWLTIGRNQDDNTAVMNLAQKDDLLFKTKDFPGPVALGRFTGHAWPPQAVQSAAALVASYSGKAAGHAANTGEEIAVRVHAGSLDNPGSLVMARPSREPDLAWTEPLWPHAKEAIRAEARQGGQSGAPCAGSE